MGWLCVMLGVIFMLGTLINPRSLWHATTGWQYRNPEANEPSDAAYAMGRVGSGLCGLILIGLGISSGDIVDVTDHRAAAEEVAAAIQADSPLKLNDHFDEYARFERAVKSALRDVRRDAAFEIMNATSVDGVHRFTLSGDRDERFCLTLTETGRSDWRMSVGGWPPASVGTKVAIRTDLTDGACGASSPGRPDVGTG